MESIEDGQHELDTAGAGAMGWGVQEKGDDRTTCCTTCMPRIMCVSSAVPGADSSRQYTSHQGLLSNLRIIYQLSTSPFVLLSPPLSFSFSLSLVSRLAIGEGSRLNPFSCLSV